MAKKLAFICEQICKCHKNDAFSIIIDDGERGDVLKKLSSTWQTVCGSVERRDLNFVLQ